MSHQGDFALESTFDLKFTSRNFSTGAPFVLSGGTIAAYPDNSTTEITAGITLTADFDARTGLNNVRVVATNANGYAAGSNYALVLTAGTVNGVSVVGEVIGEFSIQARSALRPTVAARTLDVSATGEAGIDWANVGSPTTALALTSTTIAVTQKVDVDTIKTNPVVNAGTITFPTTATLASTTNITAGTITTATNVTTVNGLAAAVITAVSIAADAITDAKVASDVTIASVTGAVGSVTGNVGGNVTGSVGSVVGAVGSVTAAITLPSIPAAWITAAGIAADAITDAKVAADVTIASVTGSVGSVTGNVGGNVTGTVGSVVGAVGSVTAGVTVTTNNDKTGYGLSAAAVQAIWDALSSALTTVGSIGKRIVDFLTGDSFVRLGAPVGASISADIAGVQSDADNMQTRIPAALVGGRMDVSVGAMAANTVTAAAIAAAALNGKGDWSTSAEIAALNDITVADIIAGVADGSYDLQEMMRIIFAACAGKSSEHQLGTPKYRDAADTKNRISATTDVNGNRTAITLDGT